MPTGIGLGLPDSPASLDNVRYYAIESRGDGIAWDRVPANPFAATVNSSGPYDKVDIWNEWVQEDWQAGVGRVDPSEGGFLYAEAETRVPNQVILPPLLQQCDTRTVDGTTSDCRYMPSTMAGTVTVGSGGYERVAVPITTPNPLSLGNVTRVPCFYAQIPFGVEITLGFYTNNSGAPGTLVAADTVTGTETSNNFAWYGTAIFPASLSAGTAYWIVVYPTTGTDTIYIGYGDTGYNTASQSYNGSSWSAISGKYLIFTTDLYRIPYNNVDNTFHIRFNGNLYSAVEGYLYKYDSANEQMDSVGTITGSGDITSLAVFGPTLWIGRSTGNFTTMNTSESFSAGSTNGSLFLEYKGLLYRAYQNDLYYSANGSTWTGPFQAGGDDVSIRGLAGLGDSVYCATDKALVRFAPGDVMEEVSRFGAEDVTNGVNMVEYQGALYIPVGGGLYRMDTSGQLVDVWVSREDDLVASHIGRINGLCRMNNWLVAFVTTENTGGRPTIWAYQDEGWHFLTNVISIEAASIISATEIHSIYYDRGTSRLWFSYAGVYQLFLDVLDYAINPFNISTYLYMPYGWIEQDRFYGGQKLLDKSWESVTISAENISSTTPVTIYFQDEASTEWELLGTATSDGQELRWNDYATRPAGKWIKLAARLSTTDGDETPRVRAMVVKFLPYPLDRIRDTVVINLSDYAELTGGTKSTYTMAQMRTHFELMVAQVDPFIYVDPLGEAYEVTMRDWNMNASKFDEKGAVKELRAMLVLEQAPESKYL